VTAGDAVRVPVDVREGLETVRLSGLTNMLDRPAVARIAAAMGYEACARWVREHRALYARGVFHGFAIDEDPACPCGCEGRIAKHDDRGWGPWPCPVCGDDSDADLGKPCTDCAAKGGAR
jgi:Domain of unknown function (DUF5049)